MSKDMSGKEKLIFISSFIWFLHWSSCIISLLLDTVILRNSLRVLPIGF